MVAVLNDAPAAVRVVEVQYAGLGEYVGGSVAKRVLGVAVDLDGAAVVAGREQRPRHTAELHGGREPLGHPGRRASGPVAERNDRLLGPAAAGQARHGGRGGHDLHETPARYAVGRDGDTRGEFVFELALEILAVGQFLQAAPVVLAVAGISAQLGHRGPFSSGKPLAVAGRAVGGRLDTLCFAQTPAEFGGSFGRLPFHGGDEFYGA